MADPEELLDAQSVNAYLARLGLSTPPPPTRDTLFQLMARHMATVPFENIDIFRGRPIALGTLRAVDKIVRRRQGGFCFEMNEAFRALLAALGFDVHRIEGRVWKEPQQAFGAPHDHLALVVHLPEGDYLADVGFGDGSRQPMLLPQSEASDISGTYRLRPEMDGFLLLERLSGTVPPRPLYRFSLVVQPLSAYAGMCVFHQSEPSSIFMSGLICTRATPNGRVTLTHDRLISVADGQRNETAIADRGEIARLLEIHFGVPMAASSPA